jgi:hypothetical protein
MEDAGDTRMAGQNRRDLVIRFSRVNHGGLVHFLRDPQLCFEGPALRVAR